MCSGEGGTCRALSHPELGCVGTPELLGFLKDPQDPPNAPQEGRDGRSLPLWDGHSPQQLRA